MLYLYLAVLIAASYYAIKLLAPEMAKPAPPRVASRPKPRVIPQVKVKENENILGKFEVLLAEKNKNISLLQKELSMHQARANDFDKVKSLLEEEIRRLREQNRIFRSELGLPTVQQKENSIK